MKYLLPILLLLTGCTIIGPGERGVRISLGSVSTEPKEPGAYLWIPVLMGMASIDVQIQKSEIKTSAASKDMQEVTTHIAVNWSLSPEKVVATYKTIGDEEQILRRIISPAVSEVLKSATSQKTAEEILTKRMDLKQKIDDLLKDRLSGYGVTLHDVSIVDLTFSKEFTDAIEKKQIAEQEAKQAFYTADKATQEARADVERAKGTAESQRLLVSTLTSQMLQKIAVDKWDGKFPQYMGGGALPFINLK